MRRMLLALAALLVVPLLMLAHPAKADDPKDAEPPRQANGLALTPPMGWNTWNKFACDINEDVIRKAADAMVSSGMAGAGYKYVVIDDCWHGARDAHGDMQPDPVRFPSGLKALGDYIHSKGLKFGIYSDAGKMTCGKRPGSLGHEYQDAAQYAAWGVDYLKYDWCYTGTLDAKAAYTLMSDALRASGRDIVFSMCEWGTAKPWLWAQAVGNLWRSTGDIYDGWQGKKGYSLGVMDILDLEADLYPYAGPGHWNDPDMLEVGNGGMTDTEYRAHFSLWALLAAPLIAGNDLTSMSPATKAILTNAEVIAVDQDALGAQGRRVAKQGDVEVWARPLASGDRAVVLLNRGTAPARITVNWADLGYPAKLSAKVRDLWLAKDQGTSKGGYTAEVAPHGVVMVTVRPAV
ncbi:glycoside hydrolase family 27 protein [Nitrospirillum viridazoti]|uniref:Alpha-galactosidase n=1 Tax=Nitrospirillum viridazoti CBAmc TaxID=1441467 RepID=A0A248JX40_9PROT|nr:glycoside hydrolase family 27 protein [Nitrospirillum amazonense]ASG23283.1 alpha-galactosidase [Nitrospirillum amazonense CBAmc]TWB40054.1 alpha-galactosidase [Nitrospirillum amazonense]